MTELPPGAKANVTIEVQTNRDGYDTPPYRLETPFYWGVPVDGRFSNFKRYHLILDVN